MPLLKVVPRDELFALGSIGENRNGFLQYSQSPRAHKFSNGMASFQSSRKAVARVCRKMSKTLETSTAKDVSSDTIDGLISASDNGAVAIYQMDGINALTIRCLTFVAMNCTPVPLASPGGPSLPSLNAVIGMRLGCTVVRHTGRE
jgi:hypothetical protein